MNPQVNVQPPARAKQGTEFTDNGYWTPQTAMLQSIREWVLNCEDEPVSAISIDTNPTLDQIVNERWPGLRIQQAVPPEHDIQRLVKIPSDRYDLCYSNQVLEHVPKPWRAGEELIRILRPGGIGIHTTCAYNPRHGPPAFNDYYRFLPDGLAELFDGAEILVKTGWGNRQVIQCNLTIDEGSEVRRSARRFHPDLAMPNDPNYPWVTWVIYRKPIVPKSWGGAGDPPAPVGDPPTGTESSAYIKRSPFRSQNPFSIPSGGSPDGTGGSPVLPQIRF